MDSLMHCEINTIFYEKFYKEIKSAAKRYDFNKNTAIVNSAVVEQEYLMRMFDKIGLGKYEFDGNNFIFINNDNIKQILSDSNVCAQVLLLGIDLRRKNKNLTNTDDIDSEDYKKNKSLSYTNHIFLDEVDILEVVLRFFEVKNYPDKKRKAIILKYFYLLKSKHIAKELSVSEATISSWLTKFSDDLEKHEPTLYNELEMYETQSDINYE